MSAGVNFTEILPMVVTVTRELSVTMVPWTLAVALANGDLAMRCTVFRINQFGPDEMFKWGGGV